MKTSIFCVLARLRQWKRRENAAKLLVFFLFLAKAIFCAVLQALDVGTVQPDDISAHSHATYRDEHKGCSIGALPEPVAEREHRIQLSLIHI